MRRLTEISRDLRKALKTAYPHLKFSVRTLHGTEIVVSLMAAPSSPFASLNLIGHHYDTYPQSHDGDYAQLNRFHIDKDHQERWTSNCYHLTAQAALMFRRISEIGNLENYSQPYSYNVGYYFNIAVGQWDKPFVIR